ncbi:putative calcium/calmodulin-dependent protein kinase [Umbelopsis sp. PMI_123]|nr:putative calcium/calmodulin-dependent protein kinase [Umbelopsis sp. PMI_123]
MLDQIKNLIKHGKNNVGTTNVHEQDDITSPNKFERKRDVDASLLKHPDKQHLDEATQNLVDTVPKNQHMKNNEKAARIVEEENISKHTMPVYPGLERFQLLEKMGDGAFSNVYRAYDTVTHEQVAVKVVRKFELDQSEVGRSHLHPAIKKKTKAIEQRANILKEIQIMRSVKHQNIVQLISFSESDEYYYLVLELCNGGELFHRIVRMTYFSEDLSRHVIKQVAEAIRHMHENCGVVHRDIKPENILFESIPVIPSKNLPPRHPDDEPKEDEGEFLPKIGGGGIGVVKIADFGLSKIIWDQSTMTPCGTVGYTAPEIVRDQRYSKSVDMWALGCVLYTILCGFPPFYDESIQLLTEKVARGNYTFISPWWDSISLSVKDLISHLLCVDPNKRYTIDEFLNHPWIKNEPFHIAPTYPINNPGQTPKQAQSNKEHTQQQQHDQRFNRSASDITGQRPYSTGTPMSIDTPSDIPGASYGNKRTDIFSPGVGSMKELFDVTYAVQRMDAEKQWRKIQGRREIPVINADDLLDIDLESSSDEAEPDQSREEPHYSMSNLRHELDKTVVPNVDHPKVLPASQRNKIAAEMAERNAGVTASGIVVNKYPYQDQPQTQSQSQHRSRRAPFELNMAKATLLSKRKDGAQFLKNQQQSTGQRDLQPTN